LAGHLLQSIPPLAVYLIVGLTIMVESLGIPVPGEIVLVTAAVLATQHKTGLSPAWIAVCGGGIVWATGMTFLIWFLGVAAERWLTRFSWLALIAAVAGGVVITLLIRRQTGALVRQAEARAQAPPVRAGQRTETDVREADRQEAEARPFS